jgi:hypothetical protein
MPRLELRPTIHVEIQSHEIADLLDEGRGEYQADAINVWADGVEHRGQRRADQDCAELAPHLSPDAVTFLRRLLAAHAAYEVSP